MAAEDRALWRCPYCGSTQLVLRYQVAMEALLSRDAALTREQQRPLPDLSTERERTLPPGTERLFNPQVVCLDCRREHLVPRYVDARGDDVVLLELDSVGEMGLQWEASGHVFWFCTERCRQRYQQGNWQRALVIPRSPLGRVPRTGECCAACGQAIRSHLLPP